MFLPILLAGLALIAAFGKAIARDAEETDITSGNLSGLYLNAGGDTPIVLIVPGSGPTDRDGNNPFGVRANTYKFLAEQLGERGVSTVRVDKRGLYSSAAGGDPNTVTVETYASDYGNWIDTIRKKTSAECVYLLGHSEGATMVSAAAVGREDVCGLILVSGLGRRFGDVLREQLRANPANAPILDEAFAALEKLEAGERVSTDGLHPALVSLFAPEVQEFLISLLNADPAQLAKYTGQRTLIIHGSTDLQTSEIDAMILAEASGGELVIVDGVNHVLKPAPADRASNLATYGDATIPVAKPVIDAIVSFIKSEDVSQDDI